MLVAIIGGIATGKTTVLRELEGYGFTTISADSINKTLLKQNTKY